MKPAASIQRQEEEEEVQMMPISSVQRQEEEELQMKPLLQRQEEEEALQMKTNDSPSNKIAPDIEGRIQSARGHGRPLPTQTLSSMGQAFNADFSGVNVHTDGRADMLNRSLQANAFTTGKDIFFRSGQYDPNSSSGQELLAHELTHVVQQTGAGNVQRKQSKLVQQAAPNYIISRKQRKMYLDFIRIKKQDTHIAKMILSKMKLAKKPEDAYGHWWIEIGDKTGGASQKVGSWTPVESYGWWPSKGVNIKETFKGVPGELNRGNSKEDPHHGDDAKTEYHPVKMVDDQEDYEKVRSDVVNDIRQFAHGFKGSWNWRLGWGKNCHTFLDRLKKQTKLHHQKGSHWLLRPHDTPSMANVSEQEAEQQRGARVLSAIQGTGFADLGDDTLEYFDTSLLTSNINLGLNDYQGLDEETRTAILEYLGVSAGVMNTYLGYAFGSEWENEFT
ncbi:MAG: DUF4157 domain-containing protein [Ardenticatenaceae bacterium]|nr:DUF4157 domain-containing protein [Ardenticatenaceae bacterium]